MIWSGVDHRSHTRCLATAASVMHTNAHGVFLYTSTHILPLTKIPRHQQEAQVSHDLERWEQQLNFQLHHK